MRRRGFVAALLALAVASGLPAHAASSDEVAFARATALAREGRCPEALGVLAGITAQSAKTIDLRAQCQLAAKDWPAALASLEELRRLDPATPGLSLRLAIARFHMGDYAGSRAALDEAAPGAQDDPQYHLYRGLVLLQEARSAEAARELARARAINPGRVDPGASYYEGVAWAAAAEEEKAREALDRVIATAPGTVWASEAARAKEDLGRLAEGRGQAWAFVRAGLEYDDNVRLLADDVFPTFEPGDIADRETHDIRAVWLLHGGAELLSGQDWAAGVQGTYYGSAHQDLTDFNEHYPSLGIWYDRRLAEATAMRLTYDLGYAWYQYDPFLFTQQVRASLFRDFGTPGRTEVFASFSKQNYLYPVRDVETCPPNVSLCGPPGLDESDARNRDGYGLTTGLEHRVPIDAVETELLGGVAYLRYSARGTEYSYDGVGAWVGTDTELPFEAALRTSVAFSYLGYRHASTYPDPDDVTPGVTYPLDDDDREDNRWIFAVELEKYIADDWSTSLRYSYTDNDSDVDVFAYDREILGAYVTYRFDR